MASTRGDYPVNTYELRAVVSRMAQLTPGDFAAVARQHRFRAIGSPAVLVQALQAECDVKQGGKKAVVGFIG